MGTVKGVEEIMAEIERDLPFFRRSGGGVTLGGGEPTSQPAFACTLLEACQEECIHTTVETCGYCERETLEQISSVTDLFLYDIKVVDPGRHRQYTGRGNERILDNLKWLVRSHFNIVIRYPLIPGYNDRAEDISSLIWLLKSINGHQVLELVPYHRYGEAKYEMLGRAYPLKKVQVPAENSAARVCEKIRSRGIECRILH